MSSKECVILKWMLQGLKRINFLKIGDALVQSSILLEIGGARAYRMKFFELESRRLKRMIFFKSKP